MQQEELMPQPTQPSSSRRGKPNWAVGELSQHGATTEQLTTREDGKGRTGEPRGPSPVPRTAQSSSAHAGFCWRRHVPPQGALQAQPPPHPNPSKSHATYGLTQPRQGAAVTKTQIILVLFDILQISTPPDKLSSSS